MYDAVVVESQKLTESQAAQIQSICPGGWLFIIGLVDDTFYHCNLMFAKLGADFKEEVVLSIDNLVVRVNIRCFGNGKILQNRIPYEEMRIGDCKALFDDMNKFVSGLYNPAKLKSMQDFLDANNGNNTQKPIRVDKHKISEVAKNHCVGKGEFADGDRLINALCSLRFGIKEKSIIRSEDCQRIWERLKSLVFENGCGEVFFILNSSTWNKI